MNINKYLLLRFIVMSLMLTVVFANGDKKKKSQSLSKTVVLNALLEVNNVEATISNRGSLFRKGTNSGYIIPHPDFRSNPSSAATVYASGLWLGGKVNNEVKAAVAIYKYDYVPGVLRGVDADGNGIYDNPNSEEFRMYYYIAPAHKKYINGLLTKADNTPGQIVHAYARRVLAKISSEDEWAVAVKQGAPQIPPGDVAAFCVYHDANETAREAANNKTISMNVEVRQLVWAYRKDGPVDNAVFIKFDFVNRNDGPIEDMYASVWSDPDLGDYSDDLVGSNKELGLGYCYNGGASDAIYTGVLGLSPPALGYDYFQGVVVPDTTTIVKRVNPELYSTIVPNGDSVNFAVYFNKGNEGYVHRAGDEDISGYRVASASSFIYYNNNNSDDGNPNTGQEIYNYMQVKTRSGQKFPAQIAAIAADLTSEKDADFFFNGNPATGTGWLDKVPDDRRFLQNNGPFTLAKYSDKNGNGIADFGDDGFNSVVVGVFTSFGTSALNSVTSLIADDIEIQSVYDAAFAVKPNPPAPVVETTLLDKSVVFEFSAGTVTFNGKQITTERYGIDNYEFEAYQIVQYPDDNYLNVQAVVIAEYDLNNGVTRALEKVSDPITGSNYERVVHTYQETGLQRYFNFKRDAFGGDIKTLVNGSKYYIGIRSLAHAATRKSGFNNQFKVGAITNVTVIPNLPQIGTSYTAAYGDSVSMVFTNKDSSDSKIFVSVVDPSKLTGNTYSVEIIHVGFTISDPTRFGIIVTSVGSEEGSKSAVGDTIGTSEITDWFKYQKNNDVKTAPITKNSIIVEGLSFTYVSKPPGVTPRSISKIEMDAAFNAWANFDPNGYIINTGAKAAVARDFFGWKPLTYGGTTYPSSGIETSSDMKTIELRYGSSNAAKIIIWDRHNAKGLNTNGLTGNSFVYVGLEEVPMSAWDMTDSLNPRQVVMSNRSSNGNAWNVDYSYSYTWIHNVDYVSDEANLPAIWTDGTRTSSTASNWLFSYKQMYAILPGTKDAAGASAMTGGTMTITPVTHQPQTATAVVTAPASATIENLNLAKKNIGKVSVYPNPYYGGHSQESTVSKFMKFIHLPDKATIKIYNLNGVLVKTIEKNDNSQEAIWNLTNSQNINVASGLYIAVIDMPGIGKIVKKLAMFAGSVTLQVF